LKLYCPPSLLKNYLVNRWFARRLRLNDCRTGTGSTNTFFITQGTSVVTFYYRTNIAETLTLTATSDSANSGTRALTTTLFQVLGQANPTEIKQLQNGLNYPSASLVVSGKLLIADSSNHRVLIWNSIPTSFNILPDLVLGQTDLLGNSANTGGTSASNFSSPSCLASDGTKLIVCDTNNNRVLIWNTIPTGFAQPASLALGQPDLVSGTVNNGGLSSSSLRNPGGIFSNGTKLIVSDETNSRVLIWNSIPVANKQAADLVLGQSTFLTSTSNNGGISASTMNRPKGVFWDGSHLAVADNLNYRVLVWNSFPTANGQAADTVIGQSNFVSRVFRNGGVSSTGFGSAVGLFSDGTRLMISNSSEFRILFTPIPGI
jgi:hypothetical protein